MSRLVPQLCLLLLLPCAARASDLEVRDAWVRLPPPGANTAGYMELHNTGEGALRVVAVRTAAALRVEMHRTVVEDGVARMRPVEAIEVPAGETVRLAPGGLHLMLIGPKGLREGAELELLLALENGDTLAATAVVRRERGRTDGHAHHP